MIGIRSDQVKLIPKHSVAFRHQFILESARFIGCSRLIANLYWFRLFYWTNINFSAPTIPWSTVSPTR